MKNTNSGGTRQNKPMGGQGNRPQNKDDIDSREGLEQQKKVKMLLITERK